MPTSTAQPMDGRLQRFLGFLREDPDNASLRGDVFEMALASGAFEIAQQQIDHMVAVMPGQPLWRHRSALLAIALKRYREAESMLLKLQEDGHNAPGVRYNLAYIAFCEAEYQKASAILAPMLDERDTSLDALPLLLQCMHRIAAIDEGIALFEARAANSSGSDAAFGIAALMAVDAGRMPQAMLWSERALRTHPMQMEALVARGSAALAVQDAQTAMRHLQAALEINPKDGRTWSALGVALMLHMQIKQALAHFENALRYMPEHIGTWHGMAWCQLMLKNATAAQASFERALDLDRNFGESHGGLAVTLAMQGRTAEAETNIERALRLDPQNLSARYAQAVLNGEVDDVDRFRALAERVLKARKTKDGQSLADIILKRRQ